MSEHLDRYLIKLQTLESNNSNNDKEIVRVTADDLKNYKDENKRMQIEPEKQWIIRQYYERKNFYDKFVESMVVVDPLDRVDPDEYPSMKHDAVRTVKQLQEEIFKKKFFKGGDALQLCLPVEMSDEFDKWVQSDFKELAKDAKSFQDKTREYG